MGGTEGGREVRFEYVLCGVQNTLPALQVVEHSFSIVASVF